MRHERWRAILAARGDIDRLVAAAVGDYPDQPPPRAQATRPAPRPAAGPQLVRPGTPGGPGPGGALPFPVPRATTAQDTARLWVDPPRAGGAGMAAAPAATPGPAVMSAAAAAAAAEHDTLHRLHQDVHARIEALRAALAAEPGGEQAMLALVLYLDEHIMGRLPDFLAPSWPLLQTRLTGRKTGGADFFRLIDRLLETEPPPPFVFEVYYFCLANGFQGQYADDLAALDGYRQRLRARIAAPEPQRVPRAQASAPSPRPIRSPVLYYVAALAVVLAVGFVLTVWSNL